MVDEPDHHDRPEEGRNLGGAAALHREQDDQNGDGQPDDIMVERGRREFQPLDRRKHGNGRCDHGIAEEHRGADHAEDIDQRRAASVGAARQRRERQSSALAIVVGAQQDQNVFAGHDDDQRPQDERQHAEHGIPADGAGGGTCRHHSLAQGVERAGADIAIDHADAAKRERPKTGRGAAFGVHVGGRRQRCGPFGGVCAHKRCGRRRKTRGGAPL